MEAIISHLDLTQIFCEVDDFCQQFERHREQQAQLPEMNGVRPGRTRMCLSEVMTIVIGFHGSRYRTFKDLYTLQVLPSWRAAFPNLVSYTRFVELMPWSLMTLCCFLHTRRGEVTGIQFIDSTSIELCHRCRAHCHQVFADLVGWSKDSVEWHYGNKCASDCQRPRGTAGSHAHSWQYR